MPKTETIPCTKEEIDKIVNASIDNDYFFMLFMVAKTTGRRLGEYHKVKVKDIHENPDGTKIMITQVLKRKKYVDKEAILSEEVYRIVNQYIIKYKLKLDDYLFRGKGHSYRHIQNRIKFYADKAEIKHNVTFHNFRHYFVTELVRKGWSYDKISKLTGHSSVGTLSVYDHAVASDIKDDALEALKDL
jgi:integrase/recombinase XerD|tara:strand:- start:2663 stop:3226 length:564 start_codon:yes stop_codon:yes gene_type:complete